MRFTKAFVVMAMVAAIPVAAAAQEPGDAAHQKAVEMAKAVTSAVYAMPQYTVFSNVDFHISADGVVVLTGEAAEKELKTFICDVIEDVDGVTECHNNLYQLGVSRVDIEVRGRVYDSIYVTFLSHYSPYLPSQRPVGGNRFMGPHPIHIVEDKGHVSLFGYVYSEDDKASATHAVDVVPGVADVKNYLKVVPKPDGG